MKHYPYFLTFVGGLLAFFSFGLPWDADHSGANLANSGGEALTAITLFTALVVVFYIVYILRRLSSMSYFAIISTLIVSSIAHFLYILPFLVFFEITVFTQLNRFMGMVFVYIIILGIIGFLFYMVNRGLFQRSWRIAGLLILGGIGIIICFFVLIPIIEKISINDNRRNIPGIDSDSGINFIIISFIASLTIICVSIFRLIQKSKWKSWTSVFVIFSSSVGLICFLILFLGDSLDLKIHRHYLIDPKYGAFLTAVGYILAIVGVLCSYESIGTDGSDDTTAVADNLEGQA